MPFDQKIFVCIEMLWKLSRMTLTWPTQKPFSTQIISIVAVEFKAGGSRKPLHPKVKKYAVDGGNNKFCPTSSERSKQNVFWGKYTNTRSNDHIIIISTRCHYLMLIS